MNASKHSTQKKEPTCFDTQTYNKFDILTDNVSGGKFEILPKGDMYGYNNDCQSIKDESVSWDKDVNVCLVVGDEAFYSVGGLAIELGNDGGITSS